MYVKLFTYMCEVLGFATYVDSLLTLFSHLYEKTITAVRVMFDPKQLTREEACSLISCSTLLLVNPILRT